MTGSIPVLNPGEVFATLVAGVPRLWAIDAEGIVVGIHPPEAVTSE